VVAIYSFTILDLPGTRAPFEIQTGTVTLLDLDDEGIQRVIQYLESNGLVKVDEDGKEAMSRVRQCCAFYNPERPPRRGLAAFLSGNRGGDPSGPATEFGLEVKVKGRRSAGEEKLAHLMEILALVKPCYTLVNPFLNIDVIARRAIMNGLKGFASKHDAAVLVVTTDDSIYDDLNPDNHMVLTREESE
jgi:hypothetical protein